MKKSINSNNTTKMNVRELNKFSMELQYKMILSSLELLIPFAESNVLNENEIQEGILQNNIQLILDEYVQLIYCLTTIPKLTNNLQKIYRLENGYYKETCDIMKNIQNKLHQLSSYNHSNEVQTNITTKNDDDIQAKKVSTAIQIMEKKLTLKNNDNLLQLLRKNVKIYYSFLIFECKESTGKSSGACFVSSSKAD